jgi:predicted SAM-dependent methyltransferase
MEENQQEKQLVKYDLGCGARKQEGHIGVDIADIEGVDIKADLFDFPYTWAEDESASEVYLSHFFEHLDGPQRMKFMGEMQRILVPGGKITIIVPYGWSDRFMQDPTHKFPPLVPASFLYFDANWMKQNLLEHYYQNYGYFADFDFTYGYSLEEETATRAQDQQYYRLKYYINAAQDLIVTMTKKEK